MKRFLYGLQAFGLVSLFSMIGPLYYLAPFLGIFGTIPYAMAMSVLATGNKRKDVVTSLVVVTIIGTILASMMPMLIIGMYFQAIGILLGAIATPLILANQLSDKKTRNNVRRKKR